MEEKKYIKALDIKEMEHIEPGHTIKLYGEETTVQGFYGTYNEGLGRWETIILTDRCGGHPFERSLNVIEVLPDQPWNHPLPPGATILPTNEQVSKWFEENIDKECSPSSAIYKFRQWLKSLPAEPTTAAAREEDAVEFAEWIRKQGIEPTFSNKWVDFSKSNDNRYTSAQLYELFKQQKEK